MLGAGCCEEAAECESGGFGEEVCAALGDEAELVDRDGWVGAFECVSSGASGQADLEGAVGAQSAGRHGVSVGGDSDGPRLLGVAQVVVSRLCPDSGSPALIEVRTEQC